MFTAKNLIGIFFRAEIEFRRQNLTSKVGTRSGRVNSLKSVARTGRVWLFHYYISDGWAKSGMVHIA